MEIHVASQSFLMWFRKLHFSLPIPLFALFSQNTSESAEMPAGSTDFWCDFSKRKLVNTIFRVPESEFIPEASQADEQLCEALGPILQPLLLPFRWWNFKNQYWSPFSIVPTPSLSKESTWISNGPHLIALCLYSSADWEYPYLLKMFVSPYGWIELAKFQAFDTISKSLGWQLEAVPRMMAWKQEASWSCLKRVTPCSRFPVHWQQPKHSLSRKPVWVFTSDNGNLWMWLTSLIWVAESLPIWSETRRGGKGCLVDMKAWI